MGLSDLTASVTFSVPFSFSRSNCLVTKTLAFSFLVWASAIAVAVWLVNFYVLLSWIQPLLFGGNWITSTDPVYLPWWVALATHLVFGWTMALIYPWGLFVPYRPQAEQS